MLVLTDKRELADALPLKKYKLSGFVEVSLVFYEINFNIGFEVKCQFQYRFAT
jgi:hypothetical protein